MQPPSNRKDDPEKDDDALVKPPTTSKPGTAKSSSTKSTSKASTTKAASTRASTTKPAPKPSAKAPVVGDSKPPVAAEPSMVKPPIPAAPPSTAPKMPSTAASSKGKAQGPDRVIQLGRTLATRNLGTMLDDGTGKLQKQLETSDATVIITTFALVAACVVLTVLVVLLSISR
jgi:hypothetical protein